ncbi:MAG: hypothetical protein J5965_28360 [Aeriscardovia sp.]|nr:hypothetical protein [Aeriscardovia sp.]
MKKILIILLLFSACSQPDKSAKKWVEEAKCVDSVKIVGQNRYANINDFQVKGLTLQDIEKLYGHYNYAPLEHAKFDKPLDVEKDDLLLFLHHYFKESDYPVVISVYDWFRHPKINKMYPKINTIIDVSNHNGSLGMCMRVYFVEYEDKQIVFDAFQTDCRRLYFLE